MTISDEKLDYIASLRHNLDMGMINDDPQILAFHVAMLTELCLEMWSELNGRHNDSR